MNKIPPIIPLLILLLIIFFKLEGLASEHKAGNLLFTVRTKRIIFDERLQLIMIPIRPNQTMSATSARAVLTYGWDGTGSEANIIGERILTNIDWVLGMENFLRIQTDLTFNEIKNKNKVDLVIIYDGEIAITENLQPNRWVLVDLPKD